jgi:Protein of unknown function (DUF1254)
MSARRKIWMTCAVITLATPAPTLMAQARDTDQAPVPVTVKTFARAETDMYFGRTVQQGGFGKFKHTRLPTPIDQQDVVPMNRDTLYSSDVFDLNAGPVTITLPDAGKAFHVVARHFRGSLRTVGGLCAGKVCAVAGNSWHAIHDCYRSHIDRLERYCRHCSRKRTAGHDRQGVTP